MSLAQYVCANLLVLLAIGLTAAQSIDIPSQTSETGDGSNVYAVATLGASVPLAERVDLNMSGSYAGGDAVVKVVQADLPIRISKFLTLTPGYFGLFLPPTNGRRDPDHRVRGAATARLSFRGFSFSDRNLFERRFRNSRDSTRYRNQIRVERPLTIRGFAVTPFVSNEVFYDFSVRAWTRNHTALGVRKTFAKRYTGDLFYQHENAQNAANNNLFFVALTIRLNHLKLFGR